MRGQKKESRGATDSFISAQQVSNGGTVGARTNKEVQSELNLRLAF
jgi:hypothetical protein